MQRVMECVATCVESCSLDAGEADAGRELAAVHTPQHQLRILRSIHRQLTRLWHIEPSLCGTNNENFAARRIRHRARLVDIQAIRTADHIRLCGSCLLAVAAITRMYPRLWPILRVVKNPG